jgi:DNA-binding beta-propeller fold protein YncE
MGMMGKNRISLAVVMAATLGAIVFLLPVNQAFAHHVSKEISVINSPLKMSLANNFLFVSNLGESEISIIDVEKDALVGSIETKGGVMAVEAVPEKNRVYVATFESGGIDAYELDSREFVKTIPIQDFESSTWYNRIESGPLIITTLNGGWSMDYDHLNDMLYVANYNGNSITVIDTNSDVPITSTPVPAHPFTAKVDPEAKVVLVASLAGSRLTLISTETNEVINTIDTGCGPWGLDIDTQRHLAYVTHRGCFHIAVVDIATQQVIDKIPVGDASQAISVDHDENIIYTSYLNQDKILKISGETREIISTLEMGSGTIPFDIAVDPESHKLYASIKDQDAVVVMGPQSMAATLSVITADTPSAVLGAIHVHGQDVMASNVMVDINKKSLTVDVATGDGGDLTLQIPRSILDAKDADRDTTFQVLIDGKAMDYEDTSNSELREITVFIPQGAKLLEIMGTKVIPEFGPVAATVLAASIGAIIFAAKRFGKGERMANL